MQGFARCGADAWRWRRVLVAPASLLVVLGATLTGCAASRAEPPADITIDRSVRYQVITGWEAAAQAGDGPSLALYRDRLAELAVNDLGINRLRLGVRSGAENSRDYWAEMRAGRLKENWRCVRYATVNDNADPNVISAKGFHWGELDASVESAVLPVKRALERRGEHLFLDLNYVAFYNQCPGVPYIHDDPEEYAEFLLAASLHLREKYGLVPDVWEVVLEPDNTPFWRGEQLGRAIVSAARRLRAAGFTPRFAAPSTTSMAKASTYFDELARVPGALPWVSELTYHRYRDVGPKHLQAIAERGRRYHVATAMLEHIGSGYEDLHRDLTIGGVSAWEQFTLAYATRDDGAQYYVVEEKPGVPPVLRRGERARFLRQYFLYIRAGAVRVGAGSDSPHMDPLAFQNANGRLVVVVKAEREGSVNVRGLTPGEYTVSYAAEGGSSPQLRVVLSSGAPLRAGIPGRGVLTIAQR